MPFPFPKDVPDPGIELASLVFPTLAGVFFTTEPKADDFLTQTQIPEGRCDKREPTVKSQKGRTVQSKPVRHIY